MTKRPILLAATLVVLAWAFAAAPVDAGGRKFGHSYGGRITYYEQHEVQWEGAAGYLVPRYYSDTPAIVVVPDVRRPVPAQPAPKGRWRSRTTIRQGR